MPNKTLLLLLSCTSPSRLFQYFHKRKLRSKCVHKTSSNYSTGTCSRFAIAKFTICNNPLITWKVEVGALYTVDLLELPKQH